MRERGNVDFSGVRPFAAFIVPEFIPARP